MSILLNNKYIIFLFVILIGVVGCNKQGSEEPVELIILHTNDTHSQVEPLKGKGGYEAIYQIIDSIRKDNPNVILLDAGDFFQGTPYFNLFNGKVEIGAYNLMGYDAVTIGNHEFDLGLDTLASRLKEANFPMVVSNYKVENTPLEGLIEPYLIIERAGIKVGIIGLGVNPENLVMEQLYGNVVYMDPIEVTNRLAKELREEGCDMVIVLSHLGFNNDHGDNNVTDSLLATQATNIDLIVGGHTHNVMGVYEIVNPQGKEVIVSQERKAGARLYEYKVTFK